jgi:hypothetical protein
MAFLLMCFAGNTELSWLMRIRYRRRRATTLLKIIFQNVFKRYQHKFHMLAHHDTMQLQDKGHNAEAIFSELCSFYKIERF